MIKLLGKIIIIALVLMIGYMVGIGALFLWLVSDHESSGIIYNLKSQLMDSTAVYKVLIGDEIIRTITN